MMPPESQSAAIVISQSYTGLGAGREAACGVSATFEATVMKASHRVATLVMTILAAACSQAVKGSVDPSRVLAVPSPWPTPEVLAPNALPRILGLWMNETSFLNGGVTPGIIALSINDAH